ncbi:MAG: hypothetical protein WCJ57_03205 [Candidatus Falkowbacteria bacterium]
MDIKDLMKNIKTMTSDEIENKLDRMVRNNSRFSNLNEKNKEIVLDLIGEYKQDIVNGIKITSEKIQHDTHPIYEKRLSLGLTERDIEDIREILKAFRA